MTYLAEQSHCKRVDAAAKVKLEDMPCAVAATDACPPAAVLAIFRPP